MLRKEKPIMKTILLRSILALLMLLPTSVFAQALGDCKQMHKVEKKETIYGISHQYGITEEELISANPALRDGKLKKGTFLCIPYSQAEKLASAEKERKKAQERAAAEARNSVTKVAVVLPFDLNSGASSAEAQRMIDFYEGFLLAVDSLKRIGRNISLCAYDEELGAQAVLQRPMIKDADIIIGPGKASNINAFSSFASENKKILVIPFANGKTVASGRPHVFQVNTTLSSHYDYIFKRFASHNKDANIIFVGMNDKSDNADYIIGFKQALDNSSIPYKRVAFAELDDKLRGLLSSIKPNIVIPSSGSTNAFEMLTLKLNDLHVDSMGEVRIFGYPEWQTLPSKSSRNLSKYKAQYYTIFYNNNVSYRTRAFNSKFSNAFKRQQLQSFPRYGEIGFDVASYFIGGYSTFRGDFLNRQSDINYRALQMPMDFQRSDSQSGWVNSAVNCVTYKADGSINLSVY